MKTTIQLTADQIDQIIGAKEEALKENFKKDIQKIKDLCAKEEDRRKVQLEKDLASLRGRFEKFEIMLDEEPSTKTITRARIDENELRKLASEGLSKSDIARKMQKSYIGIVNKMKKLGL
jgi:hypothetical protein